MICPIQGGVMQSTVPQPLPLLRQLPLSMPQDGALNLELEQGVPILRVAASAQERIESLLHKQRETALTAAEEAELQNYEELDDYLSYLNRLIRNLTLAPPQDLAHAS